MNASNRMLSCNVLRVRPVASSSLSGVLLAILCTATPCYGQSSPTLLTQLCQTESILKLSINGLVIACFQFGLGSILAAALIFSLRKQGLSDKLLGAGLVASLLGLIGYQTSDWLITTFHNANMPSVLSPLSLVLLLVSLAIEFFAYFFPSMVAYRRQKQNFTWLFSFNIFLGWLPPTWPILLFIAFRDDKKETLP